MLKKLKKLLENNIRFELLNKKYIVKIKNFKIFIPNIFEGIELIYEVFINQDYNKFDFKDKIIIDIGGFIGSTALFFIIKGAKKV